MHPRPGAGLNQAKARNIAQTSQPLGQEGGQWMRNKVSDEVKKLTEDLLNGRAEVIIRNDALGISMREGICDAYCEYDKH